jgi:nitroreductase
MNKDEFSKLAHSRRSTRDFLPDPVSQSDLDAILADGMSAPSWSNTRPFMVAVATGEQRDRISKALVSRLRENAEAPGMGMNPDYTHEIPYPPGLIERSQRVGKGIYDTLGIDRADKESRFRFMERNYEFFGAPVALFFFSHRGWRCNRDLHGLGRRDKKRGRSLSAAARQGGAALEEQGPRISIGFGSRNSRDNAGSGFS